MLKTLTLALLCALAQMMPAHAAQYTALGDSLTRGTNPADGSDTDPRAQYVDDIEDFLDANRGSWSLTNRGVYGATTPQILSGQVGGAVTDNPDLVTVLTGANDIIASMNPFAGGNPGPDQPTRDALTASFRTSFKGIVSALRAHSGPYGGNALILAATLPDLGRVPGPRSQFPQYATELSLRTNLINAIIRDVADDYSRVLVVDLTIENEAEGYDPYLDEPGDPAVSTFYSSDGFHPNDVGYSGIADKFIALLTTTRAFSPQTESLSPTATVNAPGDNRSFTATYSDLDGASDIRYAFLQVTDSPRFGLKVAYDKPNNKLYLLNDLGTAFTGGFAPGSSNVIFNRQGRLNCAATTVTATEATLQIVWALELRTGSGAGTPAGALANVPRGNAHAVSLQATDAAGLTSGLNARGQWSIGGNRAPVNVSLSPKGGVSNHVGEARTFQATYRDADGATNIRQAFLQVGTGESNVLRVVYDLTANRLYLLNDAGNSYGKGYEPGTGIVLQNSQGKFAVKATRARLLDETKLQIDWTIAALSPLVGSPRPVSLFVVDRGGLKDGFDVGAMWTITPAAS